MRRNVLGFASRIAPYVLINRGNASAANIENLGEEVRRRVKEQSGIELQWEIKRIGTSG